MRRLENAIAQLHDAGRDLAEQALARHLERRATAAQRENPAAVRRDERHAAREDVVLPVPEGRDEAVLVVLAQRIAQIVRELEARLGRRALRDGGDGLFALLFGEPSQIRATERRRVVRNALADLQSQPI